MWWPELRTELWFPDALVGASCWPCAAPEVAAPSCSLSPPSLNLVCACAYVSLCVSVHVCMWACVPVCACACGCACLCMCEYSQEGGHRSLPHQQSECHISTLLSHMCGVHFSWLKYFSWYFTWDCHTHSLKTNVAKSMTVLLTEHDLHITPQHPTQE